MESTIERTVDLFAEELPSLDRIRQLCTIVHSREANKRAFAEKVQQNMSKTGQKAALGMGIGLYIVGRDAEAVEKLEKGRDCKEKYLFLARAHRRLKNYAAAIENLDKSLGFEADNLNTTLEKAAVYRCARDFASAEKEMKKCSKFEKVSAEYHYQLGRLQEAQGLYEEAMENYKKAVELAPDHPRAMFHLAFRCDISGDEQAAMDYYKQITHSSPTYVSALLNLSVLYEDMGNFEKASQCVDKVLEYHPNNQRALLFRKDVASSKTMVYDEETEKKRDRRAQVLDTPISDFELSVRSRNCLKKMSIQTIGDLLNITEAELLSYKNFGETSLREIKLILEQKGFHLGMALEEKPATDIDLDEIEYEDDPAADESILGKALDDLNLSVRARKCLQKFNMHTLGDLTKKTEAELLGCKNFGITSLNEIKKLLSTFGLSLRSLD